MPQLLAKHRAESERNRRVRAIEEASRLSTEEGLEPGWAIEEDLGERLRAVGLEPDDLVILGRNNTNTGKHYIHFDDTPPPPDPHAEDKKDRRWDRWMAIAGLVVGIAAVVVAVVGILISQM